jgi:hypothetical protein
MSSEEKPKTGRVHTSGTAGAFWFAGWMFTIVFAKLIWWKLLLALVIWPWYLALAVR